MKKILLIFFICLFNYVLKAQMEPYPKGIYMSFQELMDKNPSGIYIVELEKRSTGKIKMSGGNDYQLNPVNKNVKKKFLKREVYAYSDGTDLFLNGFKHELNFWYSKVEGENDKYFIFKAGTPMNLKRYGIESESSDISFMLGGVMGGLSAAKRALIRLPYIMDKNTQEVILVSKENIKELISESTELIDEYEKEMDKDSVETLTKYLLKWLTKRRIPINTHNITHYHENIQFQHL